MKNIHLIKLKKRKYNQNTFPLDPENYLRNFFEYAIPWVRYASLKDAEAYNNGDESKCIPICIKSKKCNQMIMNPKWESAPYGQIFFEQEFFTKKLCKKKR